MKKTVILLASVVVFLGGWANVAESRKAAHDRPSTELADSQTMDECFVCTGTARGTAGGRYDANPVASKVYGNVATVLIEDNQYVSAGQLIIRIDSVNLQVKVDRERAALDLAKAQAKVAAVSVSMTIGTTGNATLKTKDADWPHPQRGCLREQLPCRCRLP